MITYRGLLTLARRKWKRERDAGGLKESELDPTGDGDCISMLEEYCRRDLRALAGELAIDKCPIARLSVPYINHWAVSGTFLDHNAEKLDVIP